MPITGEISAKGKPLASQCAKVFAPAIAAIGASSSNHISSAPSSRSDWNIRSIVTRLARASATQIMPGPMAFSKAGSVPTPRGARTAAPVKNPIGSNAPAPPAQASPRAWRKADRIGEGAFAALTMRSPGWPETEPHHARLQSQRRHCLNAA